MCYYWQNIRSGFSSEMDHTIDVLLLYTFNNVTDLIPSIIRSRLTKSTPRAPSHV